MNADLEKLLDRNRAWAAGVSKQNPDFFPRLAAGQAPRYLWIGCADSRVPATQITDLDPGDIFVHRNVANVVAHSDLNCLSTIQFAVDVLKVQHVIVCGHFRCGGATAALQGDRVGLVDNWLQHVRDVARAHKARLESVADPAERLRLFTKLNVIAQVANVARTTVVDDAWQRGQSLTVNGWVYGVDDGVLQDVDVTVQNGDEVDDKVFAAAARASGKLSSTP